MMMQLSKMIQNAKSLLGRVKSQGFFHIIASSSLVKVVSFISAIFLPRLLTKGDFGLLTYVDNLRNYILLINAIGISNATLRYVARADDDRLRKGYFLASLKIGILFDCILIVLTLVAFILIKLPFDGASALLISMSFLPLFVFLFEDIQLFLRASFENRKYSLLSFTYSFAMVALQIGMAYLWGLNGVVLARYLAVILCILLGVVLFRQIKSFRVKPLMPDRKQMLGMARFGLIILIANATSLIMQLNETFIIGQILKDKDALAEYRVASYILTISLFITQSVVVFIYPHFVRHMDNKAWVWSRFKKVFVYNAILMIPLHIGLILLAKPFILIIFGQTYLNSVPIMQMLLVASLGQSLFRGITGNILAGIGEEQFNLRINLIFVILHVLIDIWAIKNYGLAGAAIALTVIYFASGLVMVAHLRKVCLRDARLTKN